MLNPVTWLEKRRDGSVARAVHTFRLAVEVIPRSDGTTIECAVLACNRLVPMADLKSGHIKVEVDDQQKKSKRPEPNDSDSDSLLTSNPKSQISNLKSQIPSPATRNSQPATSPPEPCSIMVVDFMNLLVRAWHAGKPTESHAVKSMFQTVAAAVRYLRPEKVVFAMEGGYDHRRKLLESYKAHRPPHDPDLVRQRKLAEDAIQAVGLCSVRVPCFEADDVMASIVKQYPSTVVCSSDKDLLSLNGRCRIYHPWNSGKFVTPQEILNVAPGQVSDYLALCGDTVDGVPGIKGVGPKTAVDLLEKWHDLEGVICAATNQQIPGAAGRNISAGLQDALLSQQLVALVDNLPLPELNPWTPPVAWQAKLSDMRLGNVAAIMDSLIDILPNVAITPAAISNLKSQISNSESEIPPAVPPSATPATSPPTSNPKSEISNLKFEIPTAAERYVKAGFTITSESPPVPGTNMVPKYYGTWRDGSKWLIDPNSKRHTCLSDRPVSEWSIDSRGPFDKRTNAVRPISAPEP